MRPSAVVDASVLVSAFLFPESVPGRILTLADQRRFVLHLSPILLDETRDALLSRRLRDAYGYSEAAVHSWIAVLHRSAAMFQGQLPDIGTVCRDPNDDHVIAAAVATGTATIVTGDKDLLALGSYRHIRIVGARVFLGELASDA